jgi:hypothetical protein
MLPTVLAVKCGSPCKSSRRPIKIAYRLVLGSERRRGARFCLASCSWRRSATARCRSAIGMAPIPSLNRFCAACSVSGEGFCVCSLRQSAMRRSSKWERTALRTCRSRRTTAACRSRGAAALTVSQTVVRIVSVAWDSRCFRRHCSRIVG